MAGTIVDSEPCGYRWRSSQAFIIVTISLGLFSDTFLYGYIVPILSYIVEVRLSLPPSQTQHLATALLTTHGVVSVASAPIIAHFADKTSNRRIPLLLALAGSLAATLLLACSRSIWLLFLSRIFQAASGSASWIVCFATLTDNVHPDHIGKVIGTAMSCMTAGIIAGPMVSGALLQLLGYWPAWALPLILLALDAIARLVMIEKKRDEKKPASSHSNDEQESLLGSHKQTLEPAASESDSDLEQNQLENTPPSPRRGFYRTVLSNIGVLAGLINSLLFSALLSGFDTTLPLYLEKELNWNYFWTGLIFLGLQAPSMILGPVAGWLRDRTGVRSQTCLGWVMVALFLCLLGMPATGIEWASSKSTSNAVIVTSILGIGCAFTFVRGAGTYQLISVTNDLQSQDLTIFGRHGGASRVFSLLEMAFSIGAIVGPLLAGTLSGVFGFSIMVFALAILCLLVAISSFFLLNK